MQAFLGGNPMIKSVMSNPEHMAKAQEMLRNPELQKQIGGVISNPAVIKQASEVLNGLQQMNTIQAGGRRRRKRTRRKRKRKRRKSKKRKSRRKKRRKKSRRRRGGEKTGLDGDCKRHIGWSECAKGLVCQGGKCIDKNDSKYFYRTGKVWDNIPSMRMSRMGWHATGGRSRRKSRRRRR